MDWELFCIRQLLLKHHFEPLKRILQLTRLGKQHAQECCGPPREGIAIHLTCILHHSQLHLWNHCFHLLYTNFDAFFAMLMQDDLRF